MLIEKKGYDFTRYERYYILLSYFSKAFMGYYLAFGLNRDPPRFQTLDADLRRKIVWHMHPWNISLDHEDDAPSFFSYEDIRISVNYPKKIFIIFNMHVKNPKIQLSM